MTRRSVLAISLSLCLVGPCLLGGTADAGTRTLQEALALAYSNNPSLQAARAQLRSVDENVPAALAGWRPTVTVTASAGYTKDEFRTYTACSTFNATQCGGTYLKNDRSPASAQAQLTQPLYRGGATTAGTHRAVNQVMAQRARLIAQEEQVFSDTVNAFVNVIQTQQVLALNINNEQVLARQLQATNDRFRVGEITRTDVAQAEAALAGATATRQTAEGNVQTARATYEREVGELPDKLAEPQPVRLPTKTQEQARQLALDNNPNVIAARFDDAAAKDNFDLQYSALMPNVSFTGAAVRNDNQLTRNARDVAAQAVVSLSVPIYQGGREYAAVRQARQAQQQAAKTVEDQRRTAVQALISAWQTYVAAKSTIDSTRAAIRSNQIALEGVEREAIVGSRTTLDVLNAQQALLNSRVTLVQNLASFVEASYQVAASVGKLTARDLALSVPLYDDTAYFNSVKDRWIGTGDYATGQPGR